MNFGGWDYLYLAWGMAALAVVIAGIRIRGTGRASERVTGPLTPAETAPVLIMMGVAHLLFALGNLWGRHTHGDTASLVGIGLLLGGFVALGAAIVLCVRALRRHRAERQKGVAAGQ